MEARVPSEVTGISVILITKNEAHNIADCLRSVDFADEIIVVDSRSQDGTIEIAEAAGARVVVCDDWPGFGVQKNRALDLATQPWVFSIDADERVSPQLRDEILRTVRAPAMSAYRVPRLSEFCGKPIRHSGWWPDYVVRLFRRDAARFTEVVVHERVQTSGPVGTLDACLLHYPYRDLDALIAKTNRYSGDAARAMAARGKTVGIAGVVGHSMWTFIRIYFLRRGFLDGRHGFVLAAMAAAGSFFRYAKLMFINAGRAERRDR